ncbi:MAG TPA: MarR family transcriptional regulator [Acetobacterium sp.]|uniref:Winged helix DNA-binding protein n=2 Tax=Acetobacterium wieringae TaxID=52694 RepID=A0A5D0WKZ3_9FIRM|nr:MarR family transcriptional regulator [Acetobacterium wieringae]MEA4805677.1 MarR family transcriptional regulator [Acetobacterium wieringae]TYC84338.1 winged helix DNA-binding protein [Acetobacterium wieringae]HAZ06597.1 MarR family transcriptional regulator [Acetobacterium sp.]
MDSMPDQKFIFGGVQVVANQMDTLLERELKEYNLTTKQWLLTIVVQNIFDHDPTLKEVAKSMGSSHQNVKQVALKLEQKGFIVMEKDPHDARITRIKLTDAVDSFGTESQQKSERFTEKLFDGISDEELAITRKAVEKLLANLEKMDQESK